MPNERWLITGALGCVGAWCCRQLVREGHAVVGLDLESDRRRAKLIMSGEELAALELVRGDITDLSALERLLSNRGVTHVVHLAAMLIPLAAADPPRGALVNVVGTVNVFEAAKRRGVAGLAYASSAAVLASVGLRPHVVYGAGRDHGLTAGPTLAMLAAARGEAYEIPFGGRAQFQYAADVAARFIDAARMAVGDAVVRNLG